MTTQFNTRIPELTQTQLDELADEYGMTKTQIVIIAIDRLYRDLLPDEYRMKELTDHEKELTNIAE